MKAFFKISQLYCMECGVRGLRVREGDDYYYGSHGECLECGAHHDCIEYHEIDVDPFEMEV